MNDVKDNETQASETQSEEQVTNEAETSDDNKPSPDVDYQQELEMARKELEMMVLSHSMPRTKTRPTLLSFTLRTLSSSLVMM